MKPKKNGRIINVGSVSAFTGHPDLWYGATKAAIINITKTYSSQFSKFGILLMLLHLDLQKLICTTNYH